MGIKPVACTHKHPRDAALWACLDASVAKRATVRTKATAELNTPVALLHRADGAPQGMDPAIVLHQISCCCSFVHELIIIQINKQRGRCVACLACVPLRLKQFNKL